MMALHYEESLSSWEVAAYARPKLSIRITDGRYRLVTHIPLPVGLAIEAREAWQQERRAGLLPLLPHPKCEGPDAHLSALSPRPYGPALAAYWQAHKAEGALGQR